MDYRLRLLTIRNWPGGISHGIWRRKENRMWGFGWRKEEEEAADRENPGRD
jgi:hypothetical protein